MMENLKYEQIIVTDIIYEPTSEIITKEIYGIPFKAIRQSPNVYVVQTTDVLGGLENINFVIDKKNYRLGGIVEHNVPDQESDIRIIECREWSVCELSFEQIE